MLKDAFGRTITYLRVSVTDRCNLACIYCTPTRTFKKIPREDLLSLEEIADVVREAVSLGITKIRITGGEPLLRRNIESLVAAIAAMEGVSDLALTTNGSMLAEKARSLKEAGLDRVNVSLDTLDPVNYRELTGGGEIAPVLKGIRAAKAAGLEPVKINCVVLPDVPERERDRIREFCRREGFISQFIAFMDLSGKRPIARNVPWSQRPPACATCNKIRLTCDGRLFPCLFSCRAVVIRDEASIREAILKAVTIKEAEGYIFPHDAMAQIGG